MTRIPETDAEVWARELLPPGVQAGENTVIRGRETFKRFQALGDSALTIGAHCTMEGVHFALGRDARVVIGDYCYFTNVILLCEQELRLGSYVVIGWNATIADSDFHPLAPALRIADALACSPLGRGAKRPPIMCRPVIIEDDVWIGPCATILKGVRVGAGARVEPGAIVNQDVPPNCMAAGNPARIIGEV